MTKGRPNGMPKSQKTEEIDFKLSSYQILGTFW